MFEVIIHFPIQLHNGITIIDLIVHQAWHQIQTKPTI
jgi:hypothetical protein